MPGNPEILIIDDDASFARMVALVLESLGWTSRVATSAVEALDAIDEGVPRLVLCDLELGRTESGADVFKTLRLHYPDVRLAIMTGHSEGFVRKSLGDADVPVIYKPFRVEALNELIEQLDVRQGTDDSTKAQGEGSTS